MATLTSLNPNVKLCIEQSDEGAGVLCIDPSIRLGLLDCIFDQIEFSNSVVTASSTTHQISLTLIGAFMYDASGKLSGVSGNVYSESFLDLLDKGSPRYVVSDLKLSMSSYLNESTWVTVLAGSDQISGSSVNDVINAGYGFDTVYGGLGNDYVQGGFNGDRIYGEDGNDELRGGNGLDLIVGGAGNDTIRGAKGTDTLTGGEGSDVFVFERELDGVINIDTITDFASGADRIELSAAVFGNAGAVGSHVGLSQYIKYNAATGVLSYDADGSGVGAAVAFAVLGTDSHPTSVGTDFWVVI